MSHGIDPPMQPIEAAVSDSGLDHLIAQAQPVKLPSPDDPMLLTSQSSHGQVPLKSVCVEFWVLSTQKSTRAFHDADAAEGGRTRGARFVPFQRRGRNKRGSSPPVPPLALIPS